jgi:hypothetical protein
MKRSTVDCVGVYAVRVQLQSVLMRSLVLGLRSLISVCPVYLSVVRRATKSRPKTKDLRPKT